MTTQPDGYLRRSVPAACCGFLGGRASGCQTLSLWGRSAQLGKAVGSPLPGHAKPGVCSKTQEDRGRTAFDPPDPDKNLKTEVIMSMDSNTDPV